MIHDQGSVPGPQHKPSKKTTPGEREQGRVAVPKQRKEYQKKDTQSKLVESPIDKLTTDAPCGANAWSLLGHLASDKKMEGRMILQICRLSRMPQIMIGYHPGRSCSLPLWIFQKRGW